MSDRVADYTFAGTVHLRIRGPGRLVRHFDAEYGEVPAAPGVTPDVDVQLDVGLRVPPIPGGEQFSDGHKSARWRVALGPPDAVPLRAHIGVFGGPPSVLHSLVQGYVVEALVALALARTGTVALPSAGLVASDGVTVLMGRSGTGKTTLAASALAAGRGVLSDDQVIVDKAGRAWRYPRRLRLYPDIRRTAPAAWARLPEGTRARLARREWLRRLTGGYVAPSLAVPASSIGGTLVGGPLPIQRLVVVGRDHHEELVTAGRSPAWAAEQAVALLSEQRARIASTVGSGWACAFSSALEAEGRTLTKALAAVPVIELVVPRHWEARRCAEALQDGMGLNGTTAHLPAVPPPGAA